MKDFTISVIRNDGRMFLVLARIDETLPLLRQKRFSDITKARAYAAKIATFVFDHTRIA